MDSVRPTVLLRMKKGERTIEMERFPLAKRQVPATILTIENSTIGKSTGLKTARSTIKKSMERSKASNNKIIDFNSGTMLTTRADITNCNIESSALVRDNSDTTKKEQNNRQSLRRIPNILRNMKPGNELQEPKLDLDVKLGLKYLEPLCKTKNDETTLTPQENFLLKESGSDEKKPTDGKENAARKRKRKQVLVPVSTRQDSPCWTISRPQRISDPEKANLSNTITRRRDASRKKSKKYSRRKSSNDNLEQSSLCEQRDVLDHDDSLMNSTKSWDQSATECEIPVPRSNVPKKSKPVEVRSNNAIFPELERADYTSGFTMIETDIDEMHKLLSPAVLVSPTKNVSSSITHSGNQDMEYNIDYDDGVGSNVAVKKNGQRINSTSNITMLNKSLIFKDFEEDDGINNRLLQLHKLLSYASKICHEENGSDDSDNEKKEHDKNQNDTGVSRTVRKTCARNISNNNNEMCDESLIATDVACNNNYLMPFDNDSDDDHFDGSIAPDNCKMLALEDHYYHSALPEHNESLPFEDQTVSATCDILSKLMVDNVTSDSLLKIEDILNLNELDIEYFDTEKYQDNSPSKELEHQSKFGLDNFAAGNMVHSRMDSMLENSDDIEFHNFLPIHSSNSLLLDLGDNVSNDFMGMWTSDSEEQNCEVGKNILHCETMIEEPVDNEVQALHSNLTPEWELPVVDDFMREKLLTVVSDTKTGACPSGETCECTVPGSDEQDLENNNIQQHYLDNAKSYFADTPPMNHCEKGACNSEYKDEPGKNKVSKSEVGTFGNNDSIQYKGTKSQAAETFPIANFANYSEFSNVMDSEESDLRTIRSNDLEMFPIELFKDGFELISELSMSMQNCFISDIADADFETRIIRDCVQSDNVVLHDTANVKNKQALELSDLCTLDTSTAHGTQNNGSNEDELQKLREVEQFSVLNKTTGSTILESCTRLTPVLSNEIDDLQNEDLNENDTHKLQHSQFFAMSSDNNVAGKKKEDRLETLHSDEFAISRTSNVAGENSKKHIEVVYAPTLTQPDIQILETSIVIETSKNVSEEGEQPKIRDVKKFSILKNTAGSTVLKSCRRLTPVSSNGKDNLQNEDRNLQHSQDLAITSDNSVKGEKRKVMNLQSEDPKEINPYELHYQHSAISYKSNAPGKKKKIRLETMDSHNIVASSNSDAAGTKKKHGFETLDALTLVQSDIQTPGVAIIHATQNNGLEDGLQPKLWKVEQCSIPKNVATGPNYTESCITLRRIEQFSTSKNAELGSTGSESCTPLTPDISSGVLTLQDKYLQGIEPHKGQHSQILAIPSNSKAGAKLINQHEQLLIEKNFPGVERDFSRNSKTISKVEPSIDTIFDLGAKVTVSDSDESAIRDSNNLRFLLQDLRNSAPSNILSAIDVNSNGLLENTAIRGNKGLRCVSYSSDSSDKENIDIQEALDNLIRESRGNSGNRVILDSGVKIRKQRKRRKLQCQMCLMKFEKQDALDTHRKEFHEGAIEYKCKGCDRMFSDEYYFDRHIRRCTLYLTVHACEECDKKYRYKSSLEEHMKVSHATPSKQDKRRKCQSEKCPKTVHARRAHNTPSKS